MSDDRISLEELEQVTAVPARQLRELVRLGIVPPPSSRGRGASYGPPHVLRAKAWKRLKESAPPGTTNEQLRVLVDKLAASGMLEGVADGSVPITLIDDGANEVTLARPGREGDQVLFSRPAPKGRNDAALQYLRGLRSAPAGSPTPLRAAISPAGSAPATLVIDPAAAGRGNAPLALLRLLEALDEWHARHPQQPRGRSAAAETWHRVTVGRDIEISARGPLTDEELALLEGVAALLQQALYTT